MNLQAKRKELTELVDNIKEHSDRLTHSHTLPALELSVLLSKISKLHEEIIILKYELTNTEFKNVEQLMERAPLEKEEERKEDFTAAPSSASNDKKDSNDWKAPDNRPYSDKASDDKPSFAKASDDKEEVGLKKEEASLNFEPMKTQEEEKHIIDNTFEATAKETPINIDQNSVEKQPYEVDFQDLNSKLSTKEDKSIVDQLQKQPIADLTTAIGLNERYLYANELFDGKMDELRTALKELNLKETKSDALDYFDNQLMPNNHWEDKNELVKALRLLVERRFK